MVVKADRFGGGRSKAHKPVAPVDVRHDGYRAQAVGRVYIRIAMQGIGRPPLGLRGRLFTKLHPAPIGLLPIVEFHFP